MLRLTLTSDPLTLKDQATRDQSLYEIWAKWTNPSLSYGRFNTFSPCNFRGRGTTDKRFSGVRGPNFTKLGKKIGRSFLYKKFVAAFGYIAVFSNASGLKWVMLKRRQILHFLTPPPVKIRGGVGKISILIVKALPTTKPPKYIWWPSTAWLLCAVDW